MLTQQDIYVVGSENRPPMLNKENYVPWSSHLFRYAKRRPNGKLIYNSIINGPYVRRMIPEPGDQNREVPVNETFHEQTDVELTKKELKQVEADDQAIQTILLSLPEDIYAAVDSYETDQEIWLHVQQMMKGYDIGIQEKKAKLFNEWERFTSIDDESIESYYHHFSKLMNDFKRNKHFLEKIASNLKFLNNLQPEWSRHVTIVQQTKDLHIADYTQLCDFLKYNQKENPDRNGNVVAVRAEARPRRKYAAYLQTQLLIAQKEEARIQLQAEEFDLMAAAVDLDEIEEVNANCILMANLQQASTSGTQTGKLSSMIQTDQLSVEQSGGTIDQYPTTVEETHAYFESLYNNLAIEVEKVNRVNRKLRETNVDLTTELARYKNQEKAAKFVQDFKSLAKEADESLAKHKALKLEIEISSQLGDQKGKSKDSPCVSNTLDPLPQKLENENAELEFQVYKQKDITHGTNVNTKFAKKSILGKPPSSRPKLYAITPLPKSKAIPKVGVDNTAKTRRPQPRSNTKNDRVPSTSKSCCIKNKEVEVEEHHRNLLCSKNKKHMSYECNNVKLAIRNDKSKVVCAMYLDVAFRRNTCFVRNLEGFDLLKGNHTTNLYTINLHEMAYASPICLMARATSTKSCKEKSKRASHPPKPVPNSKQRLHLLHMDLCGPMRIASINGKRYVLVIVDDYSRYTWVHFLRSKDEAPEVIKTFLKRITVLLQSPVIIIRTDNGTEFKNQILKEYFDSVGISHQASSVRTPQQNGVVERRNRTLVEAARTMLIFSCASLFLWVKAIATVCYTQNRSIIHRRINKTPYEVINGIKPDISFLHVFGTLCYPKNDRKDIGKLGAKGDIGFFIGYSAESYAYRVYNGRTKKTTETMNVTFEELSAMAFEQRTMYDDYIGGQPSAATRTALAAQAPYVLQTLTASTTTVDTTPTPTNSSSQATNIPNTSQEVNELATQQQHVQQQENQAPLKPRIVVDNVPNAMFDGNTFVNPFATPSTSDIESSSS
ncbi:retrovirus-related pol polyprotein from transposon TNT 1-94 [Tanacetum coccineum]